MSLPVIVDLEQSLSMYVVLVSFVVVPLLLLGTWLLDGEVVGHHKEDTEEDCKEKVPEKVIVQYWTPFMSACLERPPVEQPEHALPVTQTPLQLATQMVWPVKEVTKKV